MSRAGMKPKPRKGVPGTPRGRGCVGGATSSTPGLGHPVGAGLGWRVSEGTASGPGCQLAGPSNPNRVLCKFEGFAPSTWGAGGGNTVEQYVAEAFAEIRADGAVDGSVQREAKRARSDEKNRRCTFGKSVRSCADYWRRSRT